MTRKIVSVLLGALLLATSLAAPAAARDTVTVVRGHDLDTPNMLLFQDRCSTFATEVPPAATQYMRRGGTRGTHAIGWQYDLDDWEVGPTAVVLEPTTLTRFTVDVHSPTGRARGHVVALYVDSTPGYTNGYWVGFASLDHDASGWTRYSLADRVLSWSYRSGPDSEFNAHSATIRDFTAQRGGDGATLVGVALGCEGEQFFVDRLVVGDATDTTTYDFEGMATMSHLEWSTDPEGKVVKNRPRFTVDLGQKFWMLGHSHSPDFVFEGRGSLWAKPYGRQKFVKLATSTFSPRFYAGFRVWSDRRAVFRFLGEGNAIFDTSSSETVTVDVRARVRASVVDKKLVQGQRLAVQGEVLPRAKGRRVFLERRVDGRWVTLDRGRTRAKGVFGLDTVARTPGTWVIRVRVASGKGNVGNETSTRTVTVKRYVPPPSNPGPPPPDPTPEADPIVTTPEPSAPTVPPEPSYRPLQLFRMSELAATRPACTLVVPQLAASCLRRLAG
jgi:hypothetical protein